jgi:hypothetical protein
MVSEMDNAIHELNRKVIVWARENAENDLYYGTPYSYCRKAFYADFISESEFESLEKYYGNLWHYRGD